MTYESVIEALADSTRRRIFERMRRGAASVGDLAGDLPISQPAVSQHLAVLREAGLVTWSADGRRRVYRADPRGLQVLRDYVDAMWDDVLAAYGESFHSTPERSDDSTR